MDDTTQYKNKIFLDKAFNEVISGYCGGKKFSIKGEYFTYADQIEKRVKDAQSRVNNLTLSILAKAFRGELTADWREQNPDLISGENSAEALLERIKADKAALQTTKLKRLTQKTKN